MKWQVGPLSQGGHPQDAEVADLAAQENALIDLAVSQLGQARAINVAVIKRIDPRHSSLTGWD